MSLEKVLEDLAKQIANVSASMEAQTAVIQNLAAQKSVTTASTEAVAEVKATPKKQRLKK